MSLQTTESFIAFPATAGDDAFNTANTALINATSANLRAAGYDVSTLPNTSAAMSGGWVTRPDPVTPERVALVHSSAATAGVASSGSVVRKYLGGVSQKPVIGGFSVFVPSEYVPAAANLNGMAMFVTGTALAEASANWGATARQLFTVGTDLGVRYGAEAPLSTKRLVPGRINFLEYRVTDTEIRVWLDDTLVLQKTVQAWRECIAICVSTTPPANGNTAMAGAPGRWAFGNWYNLYEDEIYPNVRLGPSTRIIGTRAAADVEAGFARPVGAPSNASVAGQNLVANPPQVLQAAAAGVQDIYTGADTSTPTANMVHAVAVRVMAASLDATPRTIRPLIRTAGGTDALAQRGVTFGALPTIPAADTLRALDVRPTDKRIFAVGDNNSIWMTPANGDGTSWSKIVADVGTTSCTHIRFKADGSGLIARSDGRFYTLAAGSNVPTLVTPTGTLSPTTGMTLTPADTIITTSFINTSSYTRRTTNVAAIGGLTGLNGFSGTPVGVACNKEGRIIILTTGTGNVVNVAYSLNDGLVYQTAVRNVGLPPSAIVSDGTTFMATSIYSGYSSKTLDGITWTSWTPAPLAEGGATFMRGDEAGTGGGIVMATAANIGWVKEGSTPYYTTNPVQGVNYFGAALLTDGTWIMGGTNGVLGKFKPQPLDVVLPGFSGFVPAMNVSVMNPDTGMPFTPAEAAATQFGMRAVS